MLSQWKVFHRMEPSTWQTSMSHSTVCFTMHSCWFGAYHTMLLEQIACRPYQGALWAVLHICLYRLWMSGNGASFSRWFPLNCPSPCYSIDTLQNSSFHICQYNIGLLMSYFATIDAWIISAYKYTEVNFCTSTYYSVSFQIIVNGLGRSIW